MASYYTDQGFDIKKQIRAKYGESLGPLAPASDLAEVDGLYEAFLKLTAPEKTSRAKKILEEFRKLQPGTPINSGAAVKSDMDDVKYLYSVAIQEDFSELRVEFNRYIIKGGIE
ncbi:MAG: hypothetical protein WA066_02870 [Candidatus Omnitrophota bacterium]